jgi:hypothetical protein
MFRTVSFVGLLSECCGLRKLTPLFQLPLHLCQLALNGSKEALAPEIRFDY